MLTDHLQTGYQDLRSIRHTTRHDEGFEEPDSQHRHDQCNRRDDATASVTAPHRHGEYREKQCHPGTAALAKHHKGAKQAQSYRPDPLHPAVVRRPESQPYRSQPNDIAPQNRMRQLTQPLKTRSPVVSVNAIKPDDGYQRRRCQPDASPLHDADHTLGPAIGKNRKEQQEHHDIEQTLGLASEVRSVRPCKTDQRPDQKTEHR
ncbi:hypothetical protein D3C87_1063280 [compost metagenome]